jgi:DNA replication licensing factor MCM5
MDRQSVYSLSVLAPDVDDAQQSRNQIKEQFREFILEFRFDNAFIYRYGHLATSQDSQLTEWP